MDHSKQVAGSDWLDPLNRLIWQAAFKKRATSMTLRDGRVFNIKYKATKNRDGNPTTSAWVSGQAAAPCGWFTVEECLSTAWVAHANG